MHICVFYEFLGMDTLRNYTGCEISKAETPCNDRDVPHSLYETNIKIFFKAHEVDTAYSLKDALVRDGVAIFVTDQLTIRRKMPDGEMKELLLPKDRIIMKLI